MYALRRIVPGALEVDGRPQVAIAMRRHDAPIDAANDVATQAEDRLTEAAKLALANERIILSNGLEETLMRMSGFPIAGIIGGHLLQVEKERHPGRDTTLLDTVVRNLRRLLGNSHPDVEAFALRCRRVPVGGRLTRSPIFQRG